MRLLLLVLIALPASLQAQTEVGDKYIYTGLNFTAVPSNAPVSGSFNKSLKPIIGFYKVDEKRNINDFQINRLSFNNGLEFTTADLSASYHKIIGLNKKKESDLFFGLGLGGNVYYSLIKFRPFTSSQFASSDGVIGAALSLKPVLNYAFTDRFFIGLAATLQVLNNSIRFSSFENPALPPEQRGVTIFNANLFDLKTARFDLTVGFKLK